MKKNLIRENKNLKKLKKNPFKLRNEIAERSSNLSRKKTSPFMAQGLRILKSHFFLKKLKSRLKKKCSKQNSQKLGKNILVEHLNE